MPEIMNTKVTGSDKQNLCRGQNKIPLKSSRAGDDDGREVDSGDNEMILLPEYMQPVKKTASANFRKLHEEQLMNRLITKWNTIRDGNQKNKDRAMRILRRIAMEELTKDWMTDDLSLNIRSFMVEKVLPTLVLGVEKLLVEVDKRALVDTNEPDRNFNPLNFLGQYLMRNNPKYSNFSEASPYMRGLHKVNEELKFQLLEFTDNRLLRVKLNARVKRQEREAAESLLAIETERRTEALRQQYLEWHDGRKIDLALVQNALLSFVDVVSRMSPEMQETAKFDRELDPTDDTSKGVHTAEFVEYLQCFVLMMSIDAFDLFLNHLSSCAKIYRHSLEAAERKTVLKQLFKSCDYDKVGLLSRLRILDLLAGFYNKHPPDIKRTLQNPRQWPVLEVNEITEDNEEDLDETETEESPCGIPELNDDSNDFIISTTKSSSEDSLVSKSLEKIPSEMEQSYKEASRAVVQEVIESAKMRAEAEENQDLKEAGMAVVDNAIQSAHFILTTTGRQSSFVANFVSEEGEDEKLNIKAVSAGIKMVDRGSAFVDNAKWDNWTGTLVNSSLSESQLCVFNEFTLNAPQFIQLIETFIGTSQDSVLFKQLLSYIKEGYVLSDDDKVMAIMKARLTAEEEQRKTKLNRLFDMWDNEGSGFLNFEDVAFTLATYKQLRQQKVIEKSKAAFQARHKFNDDRLTKHEFRDFLMVVAENLPHGESFDAFVDFIIGSMAWNYAEQARGDIRKKWLQQIIVAAETSGSTMEPVYKCLFDALTKDAELHGDKKVVSISIALLERNLKERERGSYVLRYTSATPDHAQHVVGKILYKDMKGISFAAVESGRPIHVPRISVHGNIHFWDPERNAENSDGAFLTIPFKDKKKKIFGLLCIDTLNDPKNQEDQLIADEVEVENKENEKEFNSLDDIKKSRSECVFFNHEIQYYQGVAKAFSIAYHLVNVRQKMIQMSEHALDWIAHRCLHIRESSLFLVETDRQTMDIILRQMMSTGNQNKDNVIIYSNPPSLDRKDNFFREYLFKCADSSELVAITSANEQHLAIPLRSDDGQTVVVYEINLGELNSLPRSEVHEMTRSLQLTQAAYDEIYRESQTGKRTVLLAADKKDNDTRTEILFQRLMLMRLRNDISQFDEGAYIEMKNDNTCTDVNHFVIKPVLCLLCTDPALIKVYDDWNKCKLYLGPSLGAKIIHYDPTENIINNVRLELIESYLKEKSYEVISKHRNVLLRHLYDWARVCTSLIRSILKVQTLKETENGVVIYT